LIDFDGWTIAFFVIALVPGVILHELMHGVVANAFGDPTAKEAGRLSLNPIRHVDPFGTVILPGLLLAASAFGGPGIVFGYAKPVPVNSAKLRNPRPQMLLVALAGPFTNLILAAAAALAIQAAQPVAFRTAQFAVIWVLTNVVLFVFNMIPLPPLDGSELIASVLPGRVRAVYRSLSPYGFAVLFLVLLAFPTVLSGVMDPVIETLLRVLLR
jgi:Zn-dependent protease